MLPLLLGHRYAFPRVLPFATVAVVALSLLIAGWTVVSHVLLDFAALLYTWVHDNTGRSVLAMILLHFMHDFTREFLGIAEVVRPIRLVLEWGTAFFAVILWGPRTLRRGVPPAGPSGTHPSADVPGPGVQPLRPPSH